MSKTTPFRLPPMLIWKIADELAVEHELPRPLRHEVAQLCKTLIPLPIMRSNENGTLWVDPLYVAYRLKDGDVVYACVSKYHINEEIKSYREASDERGEHIDMPSEIRSQFKDMMQKMHMKGRWFYMTPEVRKLLPHAIETALDAQNRWMKEQEIGKKKRKERKTA